MRALSIRSFLIQACIVSVAIWPDRIGAEDKRSAAFRIEVSQPQYGSRVGQAWTCLPAALVQSKCRQSVPLIIFGRPTAAEILVRVTVSSPSSKRYAVEVYASLDDPRGWYRADFGSPHHIFLELNSDGSLAKEIRLQYWGAPYSGSMNPVDRPSPEESLALKIKRVTDLGIEP